MSRFPVEAALDELRQAGIVQTKSIERGAIAREVLDLISLTERSPGTKFDTRRR